MSLAVPPQNLDAEESVLGAMMLSPGAIDAVRDELDVKDFYFNRRHGFVFEALCDLRERGEPTDPIFVVAELRRRDRLEDVGGSVRVVELAAIVPASANILHFARLVREAARRRDELRVGREIAEAAGNGGLAAHPELRSRLEKLLAQAPDSSARRSRIVAGGSFVFDAAEKIPALWGRAGIILWTEGEALMIVGPEGVSKTTLAQRLALARMGLSSDVLGLAVAPGERRVLYLALDRPRQIARSFRRMVAEADRAALDERLAVYGGALLLNVLEQPTALADLAQAHGADTLVVDSLKDVAPGLSTDEVGAAVNIALQHVLSAGIELLVVHHQRKAQADNKKPTSLADVYGSRWLTAGAGSVLLLWGEPGDVLLELRHLKQPADEIGPWTIVVDHGTGALAVHDATNVATLLGLNPGGLTAKAAASTLFATETPRDSQIEKARRKLEALVTEGVARRIDPHAPTEAVRYVERIEEQARP